MIVNDKLLNELISFESEIHAISSHNSITNSQVENFLRTLEKRRYNILNEIKLYNKTVETNTEKITNINSEYKSRMEKNILKIDIPELMPSYKNLKTHAFCNILLNIAEVTIPYKDMFSEKVFIYIKIFDNIKNWDVDNKFIKLIPDALILSGVIKDDNIEKMLYCVKGEFSEKPHTEVYVLNSINIIDYLEKCIS